MIMEFKDTTTNKLMNIPREAIEAMTTVEYVLDNVTPQIMSKRNFHRESAKLNAEIFNEDFLDLKVAYRVHGKNDSYMMSYLLNKDFMNKMNISEADVKEHAKENMREITRTKPLENTITELLGEDGGDVAIDDLGLGLWVINGGLNYGAGIIIYEDLMSELLMNIKENTSFYILPASVHELIVLSALAEYTEDELRGIVREVNATEVGDESKLSDELYYWDYETERISVRK